MPRCAVLLLCSPLLTGCGGGEKIIKPTNPVTIEKTEKVEKAAGKHATLPPVPPPPQATGTIKVTPPGKK
ncbi:MAG: hypothetical protein U0796_12435 [Gemmatales bacterium]